MKNMIVYFANNVIQSPRLMFGNFRAIVCSYVKIEWENPIDVKREVDADGIIVRPFAAHHMYMSNRVSDSDTAFHLIKDVFEKDTTMYTSILDVENEKIWECTRKPSYDFSKILRRMLDCENFVEKSEKEQLLVKMLYPEKVEAIRGRIKGNNFGF